MAGWTPEAPKSNAPREWRDLALAAGYLGSAVAAVVALEGRPLALVLALNLLIFTLLFADTRGWRSLLRSSTPRRQAFVWLGLSTPGLLVLAMAIAQAAAPAAPADKEAARAVAQASPITTVWSSPTPTETPRVVTPTPAEPTPTTTATTTPPLPTVPPVPPVPPPPPPPVAKPAAVAAARPATIPTARPTAVPTAAPTAMPTAVAAVPQPAFLSPPLPDSPDPPPPPVRPQPSPPSAPAPSLQLDLVAFTSPIKPGSVATITVWTAPGAECTIEVYYKPGDRREKSLEPTVADGAGQASWAWRIGTGPGAWQVEVTARQAGLTATKQTTLLVEQPDR